MQEKLSRVKCSKNRSKNWHCLSVVRSALPVLIVGFSHLAMMKPTNKASRALLANKGRSGLPGGMEDLRCHRSLWVKYDLTYFGHSVAGQLDEVAYPRTLQRISSLQTRPFARRTHAMSFKVRREGPVLVHLSGRASSSRPRLGGPNWAAMARKSFRSDSSQHHFHKLKKVAHWVLLRFRPHEHF